jgi:hypothetical protein
LARKLTGTVGACWAGAIIFLFHPLLDTVCHRPMPDLSEGVWGAAVVLCWWRLMHSTRRAALVGWMLALGAGIYIVESNRLTGVFIVPVIAILTLLYGRARLAWVLGAGAFAGVLYGVEAAFYHGLFHDWLHNLHANMGGKGKKGTEPIPLWSMPFRFLGAFWNGGLLAPVFALLALLGLPVAWRWRARPVDELEQRGDLSHPSHSARADNRRLGGRALSRVRLRTAEPLAVATTHSRGRPLSRRAYRSAFPAGASGAMLAPADDTLGRTAAPAVVAQDALAR